MEKNKNYADCAIKYSQSKIAQKKLSGAGMAKIPTTEDADEALSLLIEVKKRINNDSLQIAWSAHSLYSKLILSEPFSKEQLNNICCTVRDIIHKKHLKPVLLTLRRLSEVTDPNTGQNEMRLMEYDGLYIE